MKRFIVRNAFALCHLTQFMEVMKTFDLIKIDENNDKDSKTNFVRVFHALSEVLQKDESLWKMYDVLAAMKQLHPETYGLLAVYEDMKEELQKHEQCATKAVMWKNFCRGSLLKELVYSFTSSARVGLFDACLSDQIVTLYQYNKLRFLLCEHERWAMQLIEYLMDNETVIKFLICLKRTGYNHVSVHLVKKMHKSLQENLPDELTKGVTWTDELMLFQKIIE